MEIPEMRYLYHIRYISHQTGEPDQGLRHPEAVGLYMKPLQETGASTELSITAATNVELSQRVDLKSPCPSILVPGPSTNTTPHTPPPEGLNQALRSSKQAVYTVHSEIGVFKPPHCRQLMSDMTMLHQVLKHLHTDPRD